jgi:hypothetical protein
VEKRKERRKQERVREKGLRVRATLTPHLGIPRHAGHLVAVVACTEQQAEKPAQTRARTHGLVQQEEATTKFWRKKTRTFFPISKEFVFSVSILSLSLSVVLA